MGSSFSLKLKEYAEELRNKQQQVDILLNNIALVLDSLKELMIFSKNHNLRIPNPPDLIIKPKPVIKLDPEYLSDFELRLRNYSINVIKYFIDQLLPDLSNDIENCDTVKDMLYGVRNILPLFIENLGKLWGYGNWLRYLRPCFKGYCDFINKIVNDKNVIEAVKSLSSIESKLSEIKALPYADELSQCIRNVVNNEVKNCDLTSFSEIERVLEQIINSFKYFNSISTVVNELLGSYPWVSELQKWGGYCLKVVSILDAFTSAIKSIDFEGLKPSGCATQNELREFNDEIRNRKKKYAENIENGWNRVKSYLSGFERLLIDENLRKEFAAKRSSLEVAMNQFINEVKDSKVNIEVGSIKGALESLLSQYQEVLRFICDALPKLKLSEDEFNAIIKLIEMGGTANLNELDKNYHKTIIELCERGLLRCEVSLG